jgi:hypothetical protein
LRPPFANPSNGTVGSCKQSAARLSSRPELVQPARLELPLPDPQGLRELRVAAADLRDEALGVLASHQHFDGGAE